MISDSTIYLLPILVFIMKKAQVQIRNVTLKAMQNQNLAYITIIDKATFHII